MIFKKNIKIFSALLLIFAVLFSAHAGLMLYAQEAQEDVPESLEAEEADGDDIFVLGGIRPYGDIMSEAALVFNVDSGITVYSKNADNRVYPASTAKIMTTLIVLEQLGDLGGLDEIVAFPAILNTEFNSGDPNKLGVALAGFLPGQDNLTVRDVLYGLMLPSGCEAANILAYNFGEGEGLGRIDSFIAMMNEKASQIGAVNTNFANAHGLFNPNQWTTAHDMLLITLYAYENHSVFFSALVSETEYQMPPNANNPAGYSVFNTNWLIQNTLGSPYFYEFASGVKTGGLPYYYTNDGGGWVRTGAGMANLVSIAQRDNIEYIVVTMNAPWFTPQVEGQRWLHHAFNDHRTLYNWAFSTFDNTRVMETTDPIASVTVIGGEADTLTLVPLMENDFWTILPRDLDVNSAIHREVTLNERQVQAPIEAGAILGTVELRIAGQTLERFPLVAAQSVSQTPTSAVWTTIGGVFDQPWFTPLMIAVAVLVILLIILRFIRMQRRQRMVRSRRQPPNWKNRR